MARDKTDTDTQPGSSPRPEPGSAPGSDDRPDLDPVQLRFAVEQLRSHQNPVAAVVAGLAGSAVGAGTWAAVTVATGYQIGFMAVGVGVLVGLAVRMAGRGLDRLYGILGAALSLVGCLAGNLLAVCGIVADQEGMAFAEVLARLDARIAWELLVVTFSPVDVLFYGIAVWEGYRLSFRPLDRDALRGVLPGV